MDTVIFSGLLALMAFIAGAGLAMSRAKNQQGEQQAELKQSRLERERLTQQLDNAVEEQRQQEQALLDSRITCERTETEKQACIDNLARVEQAFTELSTKADALQVSEQTAKELSATAKESSEQLGQKLADTSERLKALQEKYDDVLNREQQAREAATKASETVEQMLMQKQEQQQAYQERVGDLNERVSGLQKEIGDNVNTHNLLGQQLSESREALNKAETRLEEQVASLENRKVWFDDALQEKEQRIATLETQIKDQASVRTHLEQQLSESRQVVKKIEAELDAQNKNAGHYKSWWEKSQQDLDAKHTEYSTLLEQHTRLTTELDQREQHFKEQFDQLELNRKTLKKEFEHLANEVLEKKGRNFKELNKESLQNLLNPIQAEMKGFRDKVEKIHERDSEQRIQLKTEMESLQKLNQDITEKADKLATALQGQKKTQGNWGELMLENVLDSSGLRLGVDYKREVSLKSEDGQQQRPDAIVYLPQNKHMVIDAKTSLVSYTEYVNAETDVVRQQALAAHAKAVSDRITELADRNYYKLPGLNSPEIVIMFVPIESAYVEALKYDDSLYQRAIEQNVLVATPTTLLTSLNIVRQLWRFEEQNKHTAELASRAERFYNKLNGFLTSMQAVGNQLDKAKDSYLKAFGQLYTGKGNLIKQASEFRDLGVSVRKELPDELVDRAHLELEHLPEKAAAES
ncbi:DNA recombination protein RmuC [Endozoicomonas montiporae]|uniref:DNA recombination protein RmuC n=1 Tax=Endozoicomonas montiporae CL-33 TaxID=570277 RepID=A0A142BBW4_9GAMM|nr:DNA recombination protein RmuC [Endozoicomonas montiporae]AMO56240.1 DNA recombination protein RmuC [Endozoicomonas montiporae CL-33]